MIGEESPDLPIRRAVVGALATGLLVPSAAWAAPRGKVAAKAKGHAPAAPKRHKVAVPKTEKTAQHPRPSVVAQPQEAAAPDPAVQEAARLDAGGISSPDRREAVVARAMLLINTPYKWGGNTPEGGFDCSGLIVYVFGRVLGPGRPLPRTTAEWARFATPIHDDELQRGDLVFFNTLGRRFSHMGLFIGGRDFVHAPSTGGLVRKSSLSERYFSLRYRGARRVLLT